MKSASGQPAAGALGILEIVVKRELPARIDGGEQADPDGGQDQETGGVFTADRKVRHGSEYEILAENHNLFSPIKTRAGASFGARLEISREV